MADSRDEAFRNEHLDKQEPAEYLGPSGFIKFFGSPGRRTCGYFWPAANAKGVVLMVHGHGSYLIFEYLQRQGVGNWKTYEGSWVQAFNQAGFSVAGLDNRGCGRSSGLLGYVEDHQLWVDDLLSFTRSLQDSSSSSSQLRAFAGLPTYLLGSSLGGNLAVHAALREPLRYAGLLLLAPMISLEKLKRKGLNPILLKVAALLNWVIPTWPIVHTNKNNLFPDLQEDWDTNPVTYHYNTRVRMGVECNRMCDTVLREMHQLACPLLVVHSIKDNMTDPDGSKMLVQAAASTDKTLHLVDNMWHVLTKEPGNQQLLQQCIAWLTKRAATAAAPPPPGRNSAAGTAAAAAAGVARAVSSSRGSSNNVSAGEAAGESWEKVEREEAVGADA
ncbi:hypothetical protein OEZ86_000826 [Tetradesmus obliquus]|nr:hypothetical protein OEZ86_000826 [Tetradesmus obliquus]